MDPLYLTTAIPFVNAAPHLGHALELVQTDAIARHARLRGRPVRFLTGTDEHAPKNAQAAAAAGVDVAAFVDAQRGAVRRRSPDASQVSYDDFIRTSADPRHRPAVEAIWRACARRRRPVPRAVRGLVLRGLRAVRRRARATSTTRLPSGSRRRTGTSASRATRSASAELIRERTAPHRARRARRNEVLAFLDSDVRDISVSRSRARARDWGIRVPDDPDQIIYVWFDALVNYLSAAPSGLVARRRSCAGT